MSDPRSWCRKTSQSKVAMVYGQMNEPPATAPRVAPDGPGPSPSRSATKAATCYVLRRQHLPLHAGWKIEVPVSAGPHALLWATSRRWPSEIPPAGAHHLHQGRTDHPDPGVVYVPADDLDRPSLRQYDLRPPGFQHRGARATSPPCIYPAVDPLDSTSRQLDPHVVGEEFMAWPAPCRARCSATRNCATSSPFWHGRTLRLSIVTVGPRAQDPAFPVAALPSRPAAPTGSPGKYVPPGRDHPRFQDDRQWRVRPPARAGLLHGRHH